jgi:flagellar hook-associated protein FlgK
MDVQVNIDDEGNYNVTLQNGQPLVSGQESSTIELDTNADGTQSMSDLCRNHIIDEHRYRRLAGGAV